MVLSSIFTFPSRHENRHAGQAKMKKADPPPTLKAAARQNRRNIADRIKKVKQA
jgi:hypothetical protein